MNGLKRVVAGLTAMVVVLSLSACSFKVSFGNTEEDGDETTTAASDEITAATEVSDTTVQGDGDSAIDEKNKQVEEKLDELLADLDENLDGVNVLLDETNDMLKQFGDSGTDSDVNDEQAWGMNEDTTTTDSYTTLSGAVLTDAEDIQLYKQLMNLLTDVNSLDMHWVRDGDVHEDVKSVMEDLHTNFIAGVYCVAAVPEEYREREIAEVLEKQGISQTSKRLVACNRDYDMIDTYEWYMSSWADWFGSKAGMDLVYFYQAWDKASTDVSDSELKEAAISASNNYIKKFNNSPSQAILYYAEFSDAVARIQTLNVGDAAKSFMADEGFVNMLVDTYSKAATVEGTGFFDAYFMYLTLTYSGALLYNDSNSMIV